MSKSELISLRLKPEDLAFISGLDKEYGTTISQKIRTLINQAKTKVTIEESETKQYLEQFENIKMVIFESLSKEGKKSEIFEIFHEWMIGAISYYQSLEKKLENSSEIEKAEEQLIEEMFYLIDKILRLGLSEYSRVINNRYFLDRLNSLIGFVKLVDNNFISKEKK